MVQRRLRNTRCGPKTRRVGRSIKRCPIVKTSYRGLAIRGIMGIYLGIRIGMIELHIPKAHGSNVIELMRGFTDV